MKDCKGGCLAELTALFDELIEQGCFCAAEHSNFACLPAASYSSLSILKDVPTCWK
jgi:hypothetical protein